MNVSRVVRKARKIAASSLVVAVVATPLLVPATASQLPPPQPPVLIFGHSYSPTLAPSQTRVTSVRPVVPRHGVIVFGPSMLARPLFRHSPPVDPRLVPSPGHFELRSPFQRRIGAHQSPVPSNICPQVVGFICNSPPPKFSPTPTPTAQPTPTPTSTPIPTGTPTPAPTGLAPAVTGINHWWTYEEDKVGGVGRYMINVANGN